MTLRCSPDLALWGLLVRLDRFSPAVLASAADRNARDRVAAVRPRRSRVSPRPGFQTREPAELEAVGPPTRRRRAGAPQSGASRSRHGAAADFERCSRLARLGQRDGPTVAMPLGDVHQLVGNRDQSSSTSWTPPSGSRQCPFEAGRGVREIRRRSPTAPRSRQVWPLGKWRLI